MENYSVMVYERFPLLECKHKVVQHFSTVLTRLKIQVASLY